MAGWRVVVGGNTVEMFLCCLALRGQCCPTPGVKSAQLARRRARYRHPARPQTVAQKLQKLAPTDKASGDLVGMRSIQTAGLARRKGPDRQAGSTCSTGRIRSSTGIVGARFVTGHRCASDPVAALDLLRQVGLGEILEPERAQRLDLGLQSHFPAFRPQTLTRSLNIANTSAYRPGRGREDNPSETASPCAAGGWCSPTVAVESAVRRARSVYQSAISN